MPMRGAVEGREGEGIPRLARIWAQISNGHNSKTVRDNPINMVHFPTKSGTRYRLE